MAALTTEQAARKLKRAKISLMRSPKFALWSGIMMIGKTELVNNIPTACTDGINEFYGEDFVRELPDKQLAFVVLHENLHKGMRHLTIWRKLYDENAKLANMACDYVINGIAVKCDPTGEVIELPMRDGKCIALIDSRFDGMNTKKVFDILKQEQQDDDDDGDGDGDGGGFDTHDWEGSKEATPEQIEKFEREIDNALRQGEYQNRKLNGKGAGDMGREIGDLLSPKVDWRELLRDFVTATCSAKDTSSWRKVNRRFLSQDVYMPSIVGESVGHMVIGIDTSGSIMQSELTLLLSEVNSIAEMVNPEKVDLIYWDHAVAAHETYESSDVPNIVRSTKPRGGGGTNPVAMADYLFENGIKPECIVMLTDGYLNNWGTWDAPIMWVITNNESCQAPCGMTIHIEG